MRNAISALALVVAGLCLYVLFFAFVAHRPQTLGPTGWSLQTKLGIAQAMGDRPKVIVAAGSNAMYSVRCEVIERIVERPCANMAIWVGLGHRVILDQALRHARPGDVVLMPLEFRLYDMDFWKISVAERGPFIVAYDRPALLALEPVNAARALLSFDLPFLFGSVVETVKARFFDPPPMNELEAPEGYWGFTPNADRRGHQHKLLVGNPAYPNGNTAEQSYAWSIEILDFAKSPTIGAIQERLRAAKADGIRVIGTFPASIDEIPLSPGTVAKMAAVFTDAGQEFLITPNLGQYQRGCFFDSPEHLHEDCQIGHSTGLGWMLRDLLEPTAAERTGS